MMDGDSYSTYRFPWAPLGRCQAFFTNKDAEQIQYDCVLSRVVLSDKNLLAKSARQPSSPSAGASISIQSAGDAPSNCSNNVTADTSISNQSAVDVQSNCSITDDVSVTANDDIAKALEKLSVNPVIESGDGKQKLQKRDKHRRKFLYNATFEEYWENAYPFLVYYTWMKHFGDEMPEDKREELKQNLNDEIGGKYSASSCYLLDEHMPSQEGISRIFDTFVDDMSLPLDEKWNLHSQSVMEQSKSDFNKFCELVANNNCRKVFRDLTHIGFVPSQEEDGWGTSATKSASQRRFSKDYGEGETLANVYFELDDWPYARPTFSKRHHEEQFDTMQASPSGESIPSESNEEVTASGEYLGEPVDMKKFSFAFDPINDSHLLARNASVLCNNDKELRKYWYQRYRLFSKLDEDIAMDREGWFSVTPERIAEHIADRMVPFKDAVIVDAFCGVGGNSIQLALRGARVIATDLDPVRLKCAIQNATVYGVRDRIEFLCCDFFHFASRWHGNEKMPAQIDGVFLSPPWGGPRYLQAKEFDLDTDMTPNGFDIFTAAVAMSPNIAYFLPRNTKLQQVIQLAGPGGRCEIEQSCLNSKIKTITAYYGSYACKRESEEDMEE